MARSRLSAGIWIGASPAVGGGHATRAARLCGALETQGINTRIYADDPEFVARVVGGRTPLAPLRGRSFVECCRHDALSIAIVDRPHHQPASTETLRALRAVCDVLVAFDENDREGRFASIHTSVLGHLSRGDTPSCHRLWGPRYAIVEAPGPRSPSRDEPSNKIVIAFGAADPAKQSEQALSVLAPLATRFALSLVIGPLIESARRRELHREAARRGIAVIDSPEGLNPVLAGADGVVTAFGQTCLEALALGVPLLLWHPSREHAAAAAAFFTQIPEACAVDFGLGLSGVASLSLWLGAAAQEGETFRHFQTSPQIDGRGAQRIAEHIARSATKPEREGVRVA